MNPRRSTPGRTSRNEPKRRGGGSPFLGLMAGVVIGLVLAAGLAAYLYLNPSEFKTADPVAKTPATPAPATTLPPPAQSAPAPQPAPDYTFYDILQGDKPGRSAETLPREVYWLQVAALSNPKEADRLKATLALLGMDVAVQQIGSGDKLLHRVRVGPFKTEDKAMSALDTLVANQFDPRLVKEAVNTP